MQFIIWLSLCILWSFQLSSPVENWLQNFTEPAHQLCVSHLQKKFYHPVSEALICGSNHVNPEHKDLFLQTGLYHFLVVSGMHFLLIEKLLQLCRVRKLRYQFVIFFIFGSVCQFSPPVLRTLIAILLRSLSLRKKLFWTSSQVVMLSGCICLLLIPQWCLSWSLLLSWLAAFWISQVGSHPIGVAIKMYLGLWPILSISPWTLVGQILILPLMNWIHFPLTWFSLLIPWGAALNQNLWVLSLEILQVWKDQTPPLTTSTFPDLSFSWCYVWLCQGWGLFLRKRNS